MCPRFTRIEDLPGPKSQSEMDGMTFTYIDVIGKGCEGWLNLFFGPYIIALVDNVFIAQKIREAILKTECKDKECWDMAVSEGKSHLCTPESPCWIKKEKI